MKFYKFHGTGNDFIMIDNMSGRISLSSDEAKKLCDRHFGVGADGVILVESPKQGGDVFMNYYNSDGSFAEMCGNGVRCTAHFTREILTIDKNILQVESRSGIKAIDVLEDHKNYFRVNMGVPDFRKFSDFPKEPQTIDGIDFQFVSMGNPHAMALVSSEEDLQHAMKFLAPSMGTNKKLSPNKINISFGWKKGENHFVAATHERGSGPTLACGTAMSGLFTVMTHVWKVVEPKKEVQIDVPGGTLFFEWNTKGEVLMSGPSKKVFEGEI